jgi:hypothetical protein
MRGVPANVGVLIWLVLGAVVTRGLNADIKLYYYRL